MNVVDSSAWLSYFSGDENSSVFSQPIEKIDELLVPSITLTEVFKCILRQRGEGLAIEAIAHGIIRRGAVRRIRTSLSLPRKA